MESVREEVCTCTSRAVYVYVCVTGKGCRGGGEAEAKMTSYFPPQLSS